MGALNAVELEIIRNALVAAESARRDYGRDT
jgi:hypothetical protein